MKKKSNITNKKLTGSYYTPQILSNFIINNIMTDDNTTILEPSCGDGVFIDSIIESNKTIKNITAIEINNNECKELKEKFKNSNKIKILNDDFMNFYNDNKKNKYNIIVGNPPYIRYQYLTDEQKEIQNIILKENGLKENKLINIWAVFMLVCTNMLSNDGKLVFVLPYELLQVNYAKELRVFLAKQFAKITIITFKNVVFSDIEQDVIVFIGEKNDKEDHKIKIIEIDNLESLNNLNLNNTQLKTLELDDEKWSKYINSIDNDEIINNIKKDKRFIKINDTCIINVGITTGNNDFFAISKEIENKYNLTNVLIPLISKSNQISGIFYTKKDFKNNIDKNHKAQLLNLNNLEISQYNDYIKYGESLGIQNGYKCSIRKRWYDVPSIWVPDALFLRRIGKLPKFIINSCNAVSTDSLNRLKFNNGVNKVDIILAYYNSISLLFTEINGRSFGGGVLEILPKELGNVYIPDISKMNENKKNILINKIDKLLRNNEPIENIVNIVDKEILQDYIKMSNEDCLKFNKLWLDVRSRRVE